MKEEELEEVLLYTQGFKYNPKEPAFIKLEGTFSINDLKEIIRILEKSGE